MGSLTSLPPGFSVIVIVLPQVQLIHEAVFSRKGQKCKEFSLILFIQNIYHTPICVKSTFKITVMIILLSKV